MKVFITSGNTWVRLDPVRVITNIFSGETGLMLANFLKEKNFEVILASSNKYLTELKGSPGIQYRHYQYFEDLDHIISTTIKNDQPDVIIHAAAVSDYRPVQEAKQKIKSNQELINFGEFAPTKKLIKAIREEYHFQGILIQFKLETVETDEKLIAIARKSMKTNASDLCIANKHSQYSHVIAVDKQASQKMLRTELPNYLFQWLNQQ